jgi:hypothetical protein
MSNKPLKEDFDTDFEYENALIEYGKLLSKSEKTVFSVLIRKDLAEAFREEVKNTGQKLTDVVDDIFTDYLNNVKF